MVWYRHTPNLALHPRYPAGEIRINCPEHNAHHWRPILNRDAIIILLVDAGVKPHDARKVVQYSSRWKISKIEVANLLQTKRKAARGLLLSGFVWGDSPEGLDYWLDVFRSLA